MKGRDEYRSPVSLYPHCRAIPTKGRVLSSLGAARHETLHLMRKRSKFFVTFYVKHGIAWTIAGTTCHARLKRNHLNWRHVTSNTVHSAIDIENI